MGFGRRVTVALGLAVLSAAGVHAQSLSTHWEELTGPDFIQATQASEGVCLMPLGILEKHGPHLPLGNDLINVRYLAEQSAAREYTVISPPYYLGQICEAKHQPGPVAYSAHLQLELLQETTDEMARNGCKKIVILNGHGGNNNLLPFFAQSQLSSPHDYVVYVFQPNERVPGRPVEDKLDKPLGPAEEENRTPRSL